ncbi:hypothetical protein C1H46_002795 [Malus baccata]|uniref:DUF1985 domain-containing protein n=1 Tax=Malus baccata TaxID=106549 RepID=A0A540NLR5_MALBA|nr:hypothetical protein C1H46_002795 [Malus baccata]
MRFLSNIKDRTQCTRLPFYAGSGRDECRLALPPFMERLLPSLEPETYRSNIRGRFSREHLHKFEDPCFGHLIDVDRIDWFGQLNHYAIFKAIKDKVTNDSMSFLFGEDVATFRSREFCLISDLKFGEFPLEARGMSYTRERRRYP